MNEALKTRPTPGSPYAAEPLTISRLQVAVQRFAKTQQRLELLATLWEQYAETLEVFQDASVAEAAEAKAVRKCAEQLRGTLARRDV